MRDAGHFRELRHGRPDGPSLVDAVGQGRYLDQRQIADYLMTASAPAVTGSMVDDVINLEKTGVAPLEVASESRRVTQVQYRGLITCHRRARSHGKRRGITGTHGDSRIKNEEGPAPHFHW
jgi:hypothetical protein